MARRKKTKKISSNYNKKPLFDLENQTKKAILAVLFFSFAIIVVLSIWRKAGPLGDLVFRGFNYLFGWGYFVLPIVFLMMALEFLKSRRQNVYFATIFGALLLFVSVLGILEMSFLNNDGGGRIGYFVSFFLVKILGFWASLVLLIAFILVALIMALDIPVRIGRGDDEEYDEKRRKKWRKKQKTKNRRKLIRLS